MATIAEWKIFYVALSKLARSISDSPFHSNFKECDMPTEDQAKPGLFAMAEASRGRVFDVVMRRKLGITEDAVRASLEAKASAGEFDTWTVETCSECLQAKGQLLSLAVVEDIKAANAPAWCVAYEAGTIDFEALLAFISKLIAMIMPFILKRRRTAL